MTVDRARWVLRKPLKAVAGKVDDPFMATLDKISTRQLAPSLGALLHELRTESGETAKTVSRRCSLGVVEIAQLELGRADLDPGQLAEAVDAYAVPRRLFPQGQCDVRVDLGAGAISVHAVDEAVVETPADRILLSYFEMICAEGEIDARAPIPFTALDLGVLRIVLASRRGEVTRHLENIVGPLEEPLALPPVTTRRTTRSAALVLAAAVTTLAGVIAVHNANTPNPTPAVAPIEVQIADAIVITR